MNFVLRRAVLLAGIAAPTAALFPMHAAIAAAGADEIVVTASKPETVASSGTKSDTPILETPQSISVIDAGDIANLGLQNLNQALRFVAGVTPEQRGASAEVYDQFKLRGFDAPVYLDGLKQFSSPSGYAAQQVDVSRLERIEVVKGPASVLYGQSSPGGLVAQSSKLPLNRAFYGAAAATYGTFDLYRFDADVGGGASGPVLWRIYGSVNGAHDQQRYGKRRRETVSAAATIGAGSPTSLTLLANYSHDPFNGNYGVYPAVGTFFKTAVGPISTKLYTGEPGDFFKRDQFGLTYMLNHDFGNGWAFHAAGRYQYVQSQLGIVYTSGAPVDPTEPAPTLFARSSYATREHNNVYTYDNTITGAIKTGPLEHRILLGYDRQIGHFYEAAAFGGATPLDVYNPVYGTLPTPRTPDVVPPGPFGVFAGTYDTKARQQGLYGQDQVALGGLRVTLSGRYDWLRVDSNGSVQKDHKFTYRAGALYKTTFGLAPYVSYSTSFEPQIGSLVLKGDGSIGVASPSQGKQLEAGLKYQVPGTEILVTGSWFRIIQDGLLFGTNLPGVSIQSGKVRSRGVEVEAEAPLPYGFNAKLAFSRQRVKSLDNQNPTAILGTGRGGVSFNLEWAPKSGPAEGLTIGGAVRHVNAADAGQYFDYVVNFGGTEYRTLAYTLFDALLRYDLGKASQRLKGLSVALNAKNIFDKKYLTTCYLNYGWCWYGNRREVQGTIGYSW